MTDEQIEARRAAAALGRIGGNRKTRAQRAARRRNIQHARKSRWPAKHPQPKPHHDA